MAIEPLIKLYSEFNKASYTGGRDVGVENEVLDGELLRGINFSHLCLESCKLTGCSLCYSLIVNSQLLGVELHNTCLIGIRFEEVHFENAIFKGCDFRKSSLQICSLISCQFEKCCLCDLDLSKIEIEGSSFKDCCHNGTRWPQDFPVPKVRKCLNPRIKTCSEYYPHP